uniref:RRM domain-containing protein n=1 Tax=Rhabditophanes sp. KR3021 TaxID=114890 RepID=A0AC35TW82_9BILA
MGKSRRSRSHSTSSSDVSETGSITDSDSGEDLSRKTSNATGTKQDGSAQFNPTQIPPTIPTIIKKDFRGRKDSRKHLSQFYKERFGSHSPDEYVNLRFSNFDMKLSKDEIRKILETEFRDLAPFEIKVVRNPDDDRRLAYVNFNKKDSAKFVRNSMLNKLQHSLGKDLFVDPAGVLRDQEGKYIPDRYNRALQAQHDRSPNRGGGGGNQNNYRQNNQMDRGNNSRQMGGGNNNPMNNKQNNRAGMPTFNLKQGDSEATRTLFVGNMPADIAEHEIRGVFEKYGAIEDIDIKNPADTNAAYSFVLFQKLECAIEALKNEHDKAIRPNSSRCKIGYGKSQQSSRLWIGSLDEVVTVDMLKREFSRYGTIEHVDYVDGQDIAYIKFGDQNSASDACKGMKGFMFGEKKICVDYAKEDTSRSRVSKESTSTKRDHRDSGSKRYDEHDYRRSSDHRRERSKSPRSSERSSKRKSEENTRKRGHSISSDSGSDAGTSTKRIRAATRSPVEAPPTELIADTEEELIKVRTPTWIGKIQLKKSEYVVKCSRIYGNEDLVLNLLRDDFGTAHCLKITQRLPLRNVENLETRFTDQKPEQMALLIAMEHKSETPFSGLIEYLMSKDAAGLVPFPNHIVYLIPQCEMTDNVIKSYAPGVTILKPGSKKYLLVAVGKEERFMNGLNNE